MIKNVWPGDLALVELLAGKTEAPREVLQKLAALGHVRLAAGVPALTPKGRRRAEKLKPVEHDLRLVHAAAHGRAPMTTNGGQRMHIGGGLARIR